MLVWRKWLQINYSCLIKYVILAESNVLDCFCKFKIRTRRATKNRERHVSQIVETCHLGFGGIVSHSKYRKPKTIHNSTHSHGKTWYICLLLLRCRTESKYLLWTERTSQTITFFAISGSHVKTRGDGGIIFWVAQVSIPKCVSLLIFFVRLIIKWMNCLKASMSQLPLNK